MIKAVIVDDEKICLNSLALKIHECCPQIEVIKLFDNPKKAQQEIAAMEPDVLFLDIEMPNINGFTLLQNISPINFEVIFTTAYSEYAIAALRISALDFLLKPIDEAELRNAIKRLNEKLKAQTKNQLEEQLKLLHQYQKHPNQSDKIALPVLNGLDFIEVDSIIKVQGENVYSIFYLTNGKKIIVSRTLKETEQILSQWSFIRVHKSFIINLRYIKHYTKGEGGVVELADGSEVEVSRRSKADFLKRINDWS